MLLSSKWVVRVLITVISWRPFLAYLTVIAIHCPFLCRQLVETRLMSLVVRLRKVCVLLRSKMQLSIGVLWLARCCNLLI